MRAVLALLPLLLAAACGSADEPAPPPDLAIAPNGVPVEATPTPAPRRPDATGPGTALGLTYLQLEDAELVDASGHEIAEVERIDADRAGAIGGLIVQLKAPPTPDRLVRIGLDGLTVVPDGADFDLRTTQTADQLAALPTVTPGGVPHGRRTRLVLRTQPVGRRPAALRRRDR